MSKTRQEEVVANGEQALLSRDVKVEHDWMLDNQPQENIVSGSVLDLKSEVKDEINDEDIILMDYRNGDKNVIDLKVEEEEQAASVPVNLANPVFASFSHTEVIPGALPHPGNIVEPDSLAFITVPLPSYPLQDSISREIIDSCKLSSLQLLGVIYACHRHQMILPNGVRAGFFIGDATGVGKGRQIAGIISDNYARGRTKHVWVSVSADLAFDARKDFSDLNLNINVIEGCQKLDKETKVFGLARDYQEGVLFSTYSTLVSSVKRQGSNKQTRMDQLVDWCGGHLFAGCLVFDECHKAKQYNPKKEEDSSKVSMAVIELQKRLPMARVVYCSATGVSEIKNMAYMERLGLWGANCPFPCFLDFYSAIEKRGLGVAEMLAMEMKASGVYLSRSLSYADTEFELVESELAVEEIAMYDNCARLWQKLKDSMVTAADRCGITGLNAQGSIMRIYWSAHQRFFKQLCMGIKLPSIIHAAKAALESGHAVIIGIQSTGEASLEHEISTTEVTSFISVCREIYKRFISVHYPTQKQNGEVVEFCVKKKVKLLKKADVLEMPLGTLDQLIEQLGGIAAVAEMTGRASRVTRCPNTGRVRLEQRFAENADSLSLNIEERGKFMNGEKFVAIISDAASTGISLHSDRSCRNQRRRVHITAELPWSADKAVQQFGRSHRSNQISGPMYKILTVAVGGERRFASSVAKRLQSLGALTKGDRRAASVANLSEFNYLTPYGKSALKTIYEFTAKKKVVPMVDLQSILGPVFVEDGIEIFCKSLTNMDVLEEINGKFSVRDSDSAAAFSVNKFLNRILGLPIGEQNCLFRYFSACLTVKENQAKAKGVYYDTMVDLRAASVTFFDEENPFSSVFKDFQTTSLPTRSVTLEIDKGPDKGPPSQRFYRLTLLTGSVVPFFSLLESVMARHAEAARIPKHERSMRIYRVKLDSGERIVGLRYPCALLRTAERELEQLAQLQKQAHRTQHSLPPHLALVGLVTANVNIPDPSKGCWTVQPPTSVVPKLIKKMNTPPLKITSFFSPLSLSQSVSQPPTCTSKMSGTRAIKQSKKRASASTATSSAKRQVSIQSLFAVTGRTCPICKISLSTEEFDNHVDNCIIE